MGTITPTRDEARASLAVLQARDDQLLDQARTVEAIITGLAHQLTSVDPTQAADAAIRLAEARQRLAGLREAIAANTGAVAAAHAAVRAATLQDQAARSALTRQQRRLFGLGADRAEAVADALRGLAQAQRAVRQARGRGLAEMVELKGVLAAAGVVLDLPADPDDPDDQTAWEASVGAWDRAARRASIPPLDR